MDWDEPYEDELHKTLSDNQAREIYFEIKNSENEWMPLENITEDGYGEIREYIRKLEHACLIERGMINFRGELKTVFRADELLPEHEEIVDEYRD